jgi:DNA-binding CsgD family transcriptional regulator/catechol 2,3-dioxygenase-like lactoylglutathione lyase family enzyme
MTSKRGRGRPAHPDVLTPAEWRVVDAVRHGMSNGEIARRRGVSLDAVKYHVGNAVGKLGLSGRKALHAWGGIRRDSHLHGREPDMDAAVELGAIGQIARSVKDIEAAVAWHRDVLGLKHLYTFGKLAFFDCGGVRLYLDENGGRADSVIYFRVPDIRSAHVALQARGIEFVSAPHLIHRHADGLEEWMAFFKDNEGRTLGIMSQVAAAVEA